jgi:hypothetical protein
MTSSFFILMEHNLFIVNFSFPRKFGKHRYLVPGSLVAMDHTFYSKQLE